VTAVEAKARDEKRLLRLQRQHPENNTNPKVEEENIIAVGNSGTAAVACRRAGTIASCGARDLSCGDTRILCIFAPPSTSTGKSSQ
jgi:hypothetical protein